MYYFYLPQDFDVCVQCILITVTPQSSCLLKGVGSSARAWLRYEGHTVRKLTCPLPGAVELPVSLHLWCRAHESLSCPCRSSDWFARLWSPIAISSPGAQWSSWRLFSSSHLQTLTVFFCPSCQSSASEGGVWWKCPIWDGACCRQLLLHFDQSRVSMLTAVHCTKKPLRGLRSVLTYGYRNCKHRGWFDTRSI